MILVHFHGWLLLVVMCKICEAAVPKEAYMTTPQKIVASGYPVEKHRVVTPDGYMLQMHRIPDGKWVVQHSRRASQTSGKRPVLLMHGLGGSSDNFVVMGPNRSLAYLLADAGYDVWIGNFRGNFYTSHKTLTRSDPDFWKFSFHEHGKTDLPTMIDHVLKTSGREKLMYVGHSMGTTSFFIMLALRPEYNGKVVSFIALTPAVYMDHMLPVAKDLLEQRRITERLRARGVHSLSIPKYVKDILVKNICIAKEPNEDVCMRLAYSFAGEDYEHHDWDLTPVFTASVQPVSFNQLEHYAKIVYNSVFTTFEGGLKGPVQPYNLSNVRVPCLLIYGDNDQLTRKDGILRLAEELKEIGSLEDFMPACNCPKFNHLDPVIAKDVDTLLNRPLVKIIRRLYNKYYPNGSD